MNLRPGAPRKRMSFDEAIVLLDKKLRALGARHGVTAPEDQPPPDGAESGPKDGESD